MIKNWNTIPKNSIIHNTINALKTNGIDALVVSNSALAKEKALSLIPEGSEVMNMTSRTLDTIGLSKYIVESGKYNSVRNKLSMMRKGTQGTEMKKLGTAPEYVMGSVHAVTEDGKVLIASNTGSQLPVYVYGSSHVIWVVGAQKIVKDVEEGIKRIYDYILPLESARFNKVYNIDSDSFVSKLLIVNREIVPGRIKMIIVKESLGF